MTSIERMYVNPKRIHEMAVQEHLKEKKIFEHNYGLRKHVLKNPSTPADIRDELAGIILVEVERYSKLAENGVGSSKDMYLGFAQKYEDLLRQTSVRIN